MTDSASGTTTRTTADIDAADAAAWMIADPSGYFHERNAEVHGIARGTLEELQLLGLRQRFAELRDRIPVLKKLADEQRVDDIVALDDVVPLLFAHPVYKSYPVSLLERNDFVRLTRWLQKLTTVDLSGVDVSGCAGIDDWIGLLDAETDLRIRHSSGTTGHLSFIPRTRQEADRHFYSMVIGTCDPAGVRVPAPGAPLDMHVVIPQFRSGYGAILRSNDYYASAVAGDDRAKQHFLYPGHQSSDLMFLAGRLRAAQALGQLQRLNLTPALLARRAEFEELARRQPGDVERFFRTVVEQLKGERVYAFGTWNVLYNLAEAGLRNGVSGVLAPESIVSTGGGAKGQVVPPDWREQIAEFFGVARLVQNYGMTEVMAAHKLCPQDRYHIEPWTILFVLDPDTGAPLPRTGKQTGRAAFFDLLADSYWGGFVSGDEVAVDWSDPCPCGKTTVHISATIERYSAQRGGGDDKITCAAAADAHDAALGYLTEALQ
jgi:hypothetical protein